jgi:hypothetical protein
MADFEREGIAVFGLSYDSVEVLRTFSDKNGITFPLLSDEGSVAIRRLGLLNEHLEAQHAVFGIKTRPEQLGVPYPGTFLLDEQGIIVEKRFEQSYRERESGASLLEQGFGGRRTTEGPVAEGGSDEVRVRTSLDSPTYRYFQRVWLTVELAIAPGMHVYGQPIPDGYAPLSIEVEPAELLKVGDPTWPEAHPFRVEGLEDQFSVYEGQLKVSVPITFIVRDAGDQILRVTVSYQACSASDCQMPASTVLELPVQALDMVPAS